MDGESIALAGAKTVADSDSLEDLVTEVKCVRRQGRQGRRGEVVADSAVLFSAAGQCRGDLRATSQVSADGLLAGVRMKCIPYVDLLF